MRYILGFIYMLVSSPLFAQSLTNFSGDYKLNFSISACNQTARVEIAGQKISIINPDPRDNRGWSTVHLEVGEKKSTLANGDILTKKISIIGTKVLVETIIKSAGREVGYTKDVYEFKDKNGIKSLSISLATETRGNVSDWGTSCGYEKR